MPYSSDDLVKAVERQGFTRKDGTGRRGTHRVWAKPGDAGDRHQTVTIPLSKKRIADGTLRSILAQLGIDEATLKTWMK